MCRITHWTKCFSSKSCSRRRKGSIWARVRRGSKTQTSPNTRKWWARLLRGGRKTPLSETNTKHTRTTSEKKELLLSCRIHATWLHLGAKNSRLAAVIRPTWSVRTLISSSLISCSGCTINAIKVKRSRGQLEPMYPADLVHRQSFKTKCCDRDQGWGTTILSNQFWGYWGKQRAMERSIVFVITDWGL